MTGHGWYPRMAAMHTSPLTRSLLFLDIVNGRPACNTTHLPSVWHRCRSNRERVRSRDPVASRPGPRAEALSPRCLPGDSQRMYQQFSVHDQNEMSRGDLIASTQQHEWFVYFMPTLPTQPTKMEGCIACKRLRRRCTPETIPKRTKLQKRERHGRRAFLQGTTLRQSLSDVGLGRFLHSTVLPEGTVYMDILCQGI